MAKKSKFGLVLLLVAIIAWLGVVRPQISRLSEKLLQSKVRAVEVASYKLRIKDIESAKANGEAIQGTLRALYLAMPKSSQIPEALVMVEQLGAANSITFNSASLGSASGNEVPVSLSFTGAPDNVNRFLDGLYNNIRTANVKSQFLSSDKSGNLTVTMQLGLVYQGGTQ